MRWRAGRMGSWKREYAMYTEKIDNDYKDSRIKKKKPVDTWDDVWSDTPRSWKSQRKTQHKSGDAKPKLDTIPTPLMLSKVEYIGEDTEEWLNGTEYTVLGTGYLWWLPDKLVVWVTTEQYKDTRDSDVVMSIELKDFYQCFIEAVRTLDGQRV